MEVICDGERGRFILFSGWANFSVGECFDWRSSFK